MCSNHRVAALITAFATLLLYTSVGAQESQPEANDNAASKQVRVRAMIRMLPTRSLLDNDVAPVNVAAFRLEKYTHVALMKAPQIMRAVLRREAIAQLPILQKQRGVEGIVRWFDKHFEASSPENSGIIYVTLTGDDAEQLKTILDAIVEAIIAETTEQDRRCQLEKLQVIQDALKSSTEELRHLLEERAALESKDEGELSADRILNEVKVRSSAAFVEHLSAQRRKLELELQRPARFVQVDRAAVVESP